MLPPPGQTCEVDINECVKSPCRRGASCHNTNGGYRCHCQAGYTGRNCETDIDDCRPSEWPARPPTSETGRTGGTEVALAGCRGAWPYQLSLPERPPAQSRWTWPGGRRLVLGGGSWRGPSGVLPGGSRRLQGRTARRQARPTPPGRFPGAPPAARSDLRPRPPLSLRSCPSPDPCHNGGSCTDGVNAAFCDCLPGFQGAFCEEDINECASNPCRHGANCTDCVASYTCTCPPGFSGIHCENNTPDCTERWVALQVHCARAAHGAWQPGPRAGVHPSRRAGRAELDRSCPAGLLLGGHGQVARQEPGTLVV